MAWEQNASNDPVIVSAWWKADPTANVGIAIGRSGMIAIDCDLPKADDEEDGHIEFLNWCAAHGYEPKQSLTAETGGGGRHILYRKPEGVSIGNRTRILPTVDVRGDGGQIVVYPSFHVSGGQYRWLTIGEPEELPMLLLDLLVKPQDERTSPIHGIPTADLLKGVPEGERDDVLFRAACRWRQQLDDESAVEVLVLKAASNCVPPFPAGQALEKVAQAFKYHRDQAPRGHGATKLRFHALEEIEDVPAHFLVRDVLLQRETCLLGGAEKTLKTWLALTIAVSVASQSSLFGDDRFRVFTTGKVLVLTGEGTARLVLRRIKSLCAGLGLDFELVRKQIVVSDDVVPITSPEFGEPLAEAVQEHDPALVIIDPLYTYMGSDGESSDVFAMGPIYAHARDVVGDRALIICVHFNKAGRDNLELTSITQAGGREFAPSWILVAHRTERDLNEQNFGLHILTGGREGYGIEFGLDVHLGQVEVDEVTGEVRHTSVPTFTVTAPNEGVVNLRSDVYDMIRDAPFTKTKSDILGEGEGRNGRRKALAWLENQGVVRQERRPGQNGRTAERYGPTWEVDLDGALGRVKPTNSNSLQI